MKDNIWQNSTKSVPENDPRVVRVPFDVQPLGAPKAALPKDIKNDMDIKHVTQGR